jgi:hypothetical protein
MSSNIGKFLEDFKNILFKEENFKDCIIDILKKKTNISIDKKNIIFRNNVLFIKTDAYIKTEIFLNKDEILKDIQNKYPNRNILDIY